MKEESLNLGTVAGRADQPHEREAGPMVRKKGRRSATISTAAIPPTKPCDRA